MFNLIIYSNPYELSNKIINPCLKIIAENNYKYYSEYIYGEPSTSITKKKFTGNYLYSKSLADEWLTRTRRAVEFSDQTGLKPVKYTKKKFGDLDTRVSKSIHCDHLSYWENSKGIKFILNEPYYIEDNYEELLKDNGLIVYKIPDNSSPYCGTWDPSPTAKPATSSYLICDQNNIMDLFLISVALENPKLLSTNKNLNNLTPWNSLKGICHV
jgi:hypothetical protein